MLWPDFRRYDDFSPETPNSTALLSLLNTGYLTRNGDYAPFAMISESLSGQSFWCTEYDSRSFGPAKTRTISRTGRVSENSHRNNDPHLQM
jgi:hypothetical protein